MLGDFFEDRLHHRRIDQHLAIDVGIKQHSAKALCGGALDFFYRCIDIFEGERGYAEQTILMRRNAFGQDGIRLPDDFQGLVGRQLIGVYAGALANQL